MYVLLIHLVEIWKFKGGIGHRKAIIKKKRAAPLVRTANLNFPHGLLQLNALNNKQLD